MKRIRKPKAARIAKACFVTALMNGAVSPGYSQDVPPAEPQSDAGGNVLRYGMFDVRPKVSGTVAFDDNIYIRPTNEQKDVIWSFAPGVLLGAGDYVHKEEHLLTLEYTPTFILFTDETQNNAIDHEVRMKTQWHPGNWTLRLGQDYEAYSGAVIDVGNRTDRQIFTTLASVEYELSPKTTLEAHGHQSINDFDRLISYNEWVAGVGMDYGVTPKVKLGAGIHAGFVDVQGSANQTYQQFLVRGSYFLTEKVSLNASAGGELRQFQGNQSSRTTPVFSLGTTYKPFENTALSLEAFRRNQASVILANQYYTLTGFSASIRQVVREKYSVHLAGGYEDSDYKAARTGINATREDTYFFVRPGVDWRALDRVTVGISYQYRSNNSKLSAFDFNNHQVGLSCVYQF